MTCSWSSITQTCFSLSYGLILMVCGPRPHGCCANSLSCCDHSSTSLPFRSTTKRTCSNRRSQPHLGAGSHVALNPSVLGCALPREGSSAAYGVQGLEPGGSGNSPRIAIQMRSGVSAYTPPTEPHVQPSCECRVSGSGCGQFAITWYGPVGQS